MFFVSFVTTTTAIRHRTPPSLLNQAVLNAARKRLRKKKRKKKKKKKLRRRAPEQASITGSSVTGCRSFPWAANSKPRKTLYPHPSYEYVWRSVSRTHCKEFGRHLGHAATQGFLLGCNCDNGQEALPSIHAESVSIYSAEHGIQRLGETREM